MAATPDPARSRAAFFFAVGTATLLALWLRAWGVTGQVVLDDEWHAIHKLLEASYSGIFKSFGLSDHSIPLTMFYKWMANNFGLAEGRLRLLQILFGVALVPACAWLAWASVRDRAAAALLAFLVAGAPFLVMWSRFARPYAISLLLTVLCVAAIWRWRTRRTNALWACAAATAALATWFHPLMGMYPALACLYVFGEDLLAARTAPRAWRGSFRFGAGVAAAMSVLLIYPVYKDLDKLSAKAGSDHPNLDTYERMFSIVWGGLPAPAYVAALLATAWGFAVLCRRQPRFAGLLAVLAIAPAALLTFTGAAWVFSGQNFLRYQLPLQVLLLFLGSVGAISLARLVARQAAEPVAWVAVIALSAGYLALTPAIPQVARLGTWYAHIDHHWDYRQRFMLYKRAHPRFDPPPFYRNLGAMAAGTIVEAPFEFEAPHDQLGYYATYHHQREVFGMLHDVCGASLRMGEVPPRDRRFRFRRFVFLDDPAAVRATGARYFIFNRDFKRRAAPLLPDCVARLARIYGPPSQEDERTVVWDLSSVAAAK